MFRKYSKEDVSLLRDGIIGVYYCGFMLSDGNLRPVYIGKSSSEQGVKGRLLHHLNNDYWPEATHYLVETCINDNDAYSLESREIKRCQPKYNELGK